MLHLPDQAVLDVVGGHTQLHQPAHDHLEEEIGHIGARAADEEADSEEAGEEHAGGDGGADLGEVDDSEDAARGVFLGGPGHGEAFVAPVGPVGEDEVVACGVDRVADELAETFWAVDVIEAGDVWLDADLSLGDGHGVGFPREGERSAFYAPVYEEVVEQAFLAAIANQRVRTAAWTDDCSFVVRAGQLAAILFTARPFIAVEFDKTLLG